MILFVMQAGLVCEGAVLEKRDQPLLYGLSTAADELMTFNSPDTIGDKNAFYVNASHLGWLVSISGWLVVPVLIGCVVAHAHDLENDEWTLRMRLTRLGRRAGLTDPELSKTVNEIINDLKGRIGF